MDTKYNILFKEKELHSNLTEEEYFDILEDIAQEFYANGSPNPNDITTEMIEGV